MNFTAGNSIEVTSTKLSTRKIYVEKDTDGDGIPNKVDLDDDNDGIPDTKDSNPLVKTKIKKDNFSIDNISVAGKNFLNKITNRGKGDNGENKKVASTEKKNEVSNIVASTLQKTKGITEVFKEIENARKKGASAVKSYENEHRAKLKKIIENENKKKAVEGFKITNEEKSKKREQQLAAAGAATLGVMLEKPMLFYLEIVVLTLGVFHLFAVWIRSRLYKARCKKDEE